MKNKKPNKGKSTSKMIRENDVKPKCHYVIGYVYHLRSIIEGIGW